MWKAAGQLYKYAIVHLYLKNICLFKIYCDG
jgi:hypothetical protein